MGALLNLREGQAVLAQYGALEVRFGQQVVLHTIEVVGIAALALLLLARISLLLVLA